MPSHVPNTRSRQMQQSKGNCIEGSCTTRYQPVAICQSQESPYQDHQGNPMVPVIVFKASRETVQQHPVMKRSHHHPEERSSMDQKDSETVKLGPFRRKRGRNTHTNCKNPNSVLKWLEISPSWETARKQQLSGPLRTIQDTSTGIPVATRPLKGTVFLFIDKGGCRGIVMPRSHQYAWAPMRQWPLGVSAITKPHMGNLPSGHLPRPL